jgi:hypothetical protein
MARLMTFQRLGFSAFGDGAFSSSTSSSSTRTARCDKSDCPICYPLLGIALTLVNLRTAESRLPPQSVEREGMGTHGGDAPAASLESKISISAQLFSGSSMVTSGSLL